MTTQTPSPESPPWSANVKLVIGLTVVAIIAALLIRFKSIIAPLILTFILTYLLHPVVSKLHEATKFSWRMSVNLVYIAVVILLLASFTATGLALVQQLESLILVVERFINTLPDLVLEWSTQAYEIGPFQLDVSQYLSTTNLEALIQQMISAVSPLLGQAGSVLRTVATGTFSTVGWVFFVVLLSYFLLADMGRVPDKFVEIDLPGYSEDIKRMSQELARIWDAFLRGQIILFTLTVLVYTLLLSILGVRYFLGLALLAGFARFVPYLGQWVNWAVLILVTLFQRSNYLGLEPLYFMLLVFLVALIVDQIFDSILAPRILGQSLGLHPAAVLVAAIIALNLLGLLGVVLAAPVLATLVLVGRYVARKMLDLDPWPEPPEGRGEVKYPWSGWKQRGANWLRSLRQRISRKDGR
jgi:predicted PurR-regulated permease PerM